MILILPRSQSDGWYAEALLQRGHQVLPYDVAAAHDFIIDEYALRCDGCLLLGNADDHLRLADRFVEMGKPVWRHLADVPARIET